MALLPYPDEATADPRARAVLERLPVRLNLFSMLANAPSLMAETLRLGEAILTRSELEPDLRELAILQTARLTGTDYEWIQHVPIGKAVGVSRRADRGARARGDRRRGLRRARDARAADRRRGASASGEPAASSSSRRRPSSDRQRWSSCC